MKPLDELRAAFTGAGVDLDAPIVTSCGSGVSARRADARALSPGRARHRALRRLMVGMGPGGRPADRDRSGLSLIGACAWRRLRASGRLLLPNGSSCCRDLLRRRARRTMRRRFFARCARARLLSGAAVGFASAAFAGAIFDRRRPGRPALRSWSRAMRLPVSAASRQLGGARSPAVGVARRRSEPSCRRGVSVSAVREPQPGLGRLRLALRRRAPAVSAGRRDGGDLRTRPAARPARLERYCGHLSGSASTAGSPMLGHRSPRSTGVASSAVGATGSTRSSRQHRLGRFGMPARTPAPAAVRQDGMLTNSSWARAAARRRPSRTPGSTSTAGSRRTGNESREASDARFRLGGSCEGL